ncbi:hypothetical protein DID80_06695 [Candidatus Marinamargulisbacteria bacterium SCGC AAA071-K20]|nr:hypothetical protein DID80_06695 [Candidatus Marinamargulisbacteria bacterium SCGC AAA071-K20]
MLSFLPLLIIGLLNIGFGTYVYFKNQKNKNHLAFFLFSSSLGLWNIVYAISELPFENMLLITRLIVLPANFIPITFHWFTNTLYTPDKKIHMSLKVTHTIVLSILIATLPTKYFISSAQYLNNAIKFTYGPAYNLQGLYLVLFMGIGIYTLAKKYKMATKVQKSQIQYMALGAFIGTVIGTIFSYILPIFGYAEFNIYTNASSIFFVFFAHYAITKHRLMNVIIVINKTTAWIMSLAIFTRTYLFTNILLSKVITITNPIQLTLSTIYALLMAFTFNHLRLFIQTTSEKQFLSEHKKFIDKLPEITHAFSACYNLESFEKITKHCFKNILEISNGSIYIDSRFYQGKLPIGFFTELNLSKDSHKQVSYNHPLVTRLKHTQEIIVKNELKEIDKNLLSEFDFVLSVPCFNEDKLSAFFCLDSKYSEYIYTYDDFKFLEIISSQMAIILERIIPFEKVQKDYERTREYAEKISQQKAFTQLSMGIAHEIRNPISNLLLRAEIVEKKLDDPEAVLKFSDMIKRNITRILRITNAMLKYGTPTSKERKKGDINFTLKEVVDMVDTKCNQSNITIKTLLGPIQPLHYDEAALYQAFSNIILNAIDSIGNKGGKLTITTSNTRIKNTEGNINEGMIISIQDSGVGIDSETISKIYNPFFSTKYSHIGLGLSMALKGIHAHKGSIDIQSEVGEGTIFKIFLPYVNQTVPVPSLA